MLTNPGQSRYKHVIVDTNAGQNRHKHRWELTEKQVRADKHFSRHKHRWEQREKQVRAYTDTGQSRNKHRSELTQTHQSGAQTQIEQTQTQVRLDTKHR